MKSNNSKYLIIGGVTILGGLGAYYWIKKKKASKAALMENQNINQSTSGNPLMVNAPIVNTPIVNGFPLKYGMKNDLNVLALQKALQKKLTPTKWPDSQITGNYMEKTAAAVKSFIGRDTVTEADFRQFVGSPVTSSNSVNVMSINPVSNVFSSQNLSNWGTYLKKLVS